MDLSKCQFVATLAVIFFEIFDLVVDWLFYMEVSSTEKGLVYGPPEQGAIHALLVFSAIGTLAFLIEMANIIWKLRTDKSVVNIDLVAVVVLWLEDIPQVIISVKIAFCREDIISIFQTLKACLVIFVIIVRVFLTIVRYCSQDCQKQANCRLYRVLIMIGLFLSFVGAITVFVLTKSRKHNDCINFPAPSLEENVHGDRYFDNVGIFFRHPTFDVNESNDVTEANWIRLITLNSMRTMGGKEVLLNYEYIDTPNERQFVLKKSVDGLQWKPTECYTINNANVSMTKGVNCSSHIGNGGNSTSILFKFVFIQPGGFPRKLYFGDIKFKAIILNNKSSCKNGVPGNIQTGVPGNISFNDAVQYYQTHGGEGNHVVASDTLRFYRKEDLTDITKVWKTGWSNCEPKGNLAPRYDSNIDVPCDVI